MIERAASAALFVCTPIVQFQNQIKMKKISAKMFFTVMWRGLCQAFGWFLGLFGYRRDGKFAKCVWGLFATSAAIVMGIIAIALVLTLGDEACRWYNKQHDHCYNPDCWASTHISQDIYYHEHEDGKGYVFNQRTGEKLIKHIKWIAEPNGKDSLVCFSNGKKRGYFSKNTGKVVIKPKYDRAWVFSEGLASVEEDGHIKFIDGTGEVVIDNNMPYIPDMEGYVFHEEYCVVHSDDGQLDGLMDKNGKIVLPIIYDRIDLADDYALWLVQKNEEAAVLDKDLHAVIPLMAGTIYIGEGTIDVTMPDHTMRKYDMEGTLINDFYIASVRMLEYEKEDIIYRKNPTMEDGDGIFVELEEFYHPKATARLRAYVAGEGYEGLMTADGHKVTMPLYKDIEAIDHDLYLCTSTNYDKVIVNGKGEIVK